MALITPNQVFSLALCEDLRIILPDIPTIVIAAVLALDSTPKHGGYARRHPPGIVDALLGQP